LEERINQLLIEKKELAAQSVGTGDEWFTDMGTEQLREIFALNISTAVQE
jgi:SNF2 family DNA or RNA helicase